MKNLLFLLIGLMSMVASAAKNPYPVLAACNLILYDVPGGVTVGDDSDEVVLPKFQLSPSTDLLLSATRNGKTYVFSGHLVRDDGTEYMSITLSKLVGDKKVELTDARTSTDTRLEPFDTLNGVHYILEGNDRIGYFSCGMYVRSN